MELSGPPDGPGSFDVAYSDEVKENGLAVIDELTNDCRFQLPKMIPGFPAPALFAMSVVVLGFFREDEWRAWPEEPQETELALKSAGKSFGDYLRDVVQIAQTLDFVAWLRDRMGNDDGPLKGLLTGSPYDSPWVGDVIDGFMSEKVEPAKPPTVGSSGSVEKPNPEQPTTKPTAQTSGGPSKDAIAAAMVAEAVMTRGRKIPSIAQLAKSLGIPKSTLHDDKDRDVQRYPLLWLALASQIGNPPPRGSKDQYRNIEAEDDRER